MASGSDQAPIHPASQSLAAEGPAPPARTGLQMRWVWLSLLPLGLGVWVPVYTGVVERKRGFTVIGLLWVAVAVTGWVMSSSASNGLAGGLIIIAWVGAFATALALRGVLKREAASGFDAAVAAGRTRLANRAHACQIAREQPQLAKELGIGRPDLPGAQDAGLIDVNHVPASVLARLPGFDGVLAAKIAAARDEIHGWSSLEDMGSQMNLDGNLVEDIRDRVIFLPR